MRSPPPPWDEVSIWTSKAWDEVSESGGVGMASGVV